MADGAQLVLAKRGEGCGGRWVGQGVDQVAGSTLGVVGGGRLGYGAIAGKKIGGLDDAFGSCGRYVDAIAEIVLRGCANVLAVNAMNVPGAADVQDFMEKDLSAGWCKGRAIEIVDAVDLGFGGKPRVDAGRLENTERGCCLGNEAAPQMDGKIGVNAGQAGKEMTFPSVNRFFGNVSTMDVGRHKLVVKRDGLHVASEAVGTFVVQYF